MTKTRILALLLAFTMILSMGFSTHVDASSDFSDIEGHYAKLTVEKWSKEGIVGGYKGLFRPNESITRGELAIILNNLMKYQVKSENKFNDLQEEFYTDAILKANAAGVIHGSKDKVRPKDNATREETVVMFAQAFGISKSSTTDMKFEDSSSISGWALGYVNAFSDKKYVSGRGQNRFCPKDNITRAEALVIIDNIVSAFYNEAGTYTKDSDGTNIDNSVIVNTSGVTLRNMTIKGDLTIAEGVGDGEVTLDGIKVEGKTFVRGGGKNSIKIIGDSVLGNIIVERVDGQVRVVTEGNAKVETVIIDDGSDDVILEGKLKNVEIKADNIVVKAQKAQINQVLISSKSTALNVDKDTNISTVNVTGTAKGIKVDVSGKITSMLIEAPLTAIKGEGKIENANIKADNTIIDIKGTKLVVDKNVAGTSTNGKKVEAGSSTTTGQEVIITPPPSTGGNPTNPTTPTTPTTPTKISVTGVTVVDENSVEIQNVKVGDKLHAKVTPENAKVTYSWKITTTIWNGKEMHSTTEEVCTSNVYTVGIADQGRKLTLTVVGIENSEGSITIEVSSYINRNICDLKASVTPTKLTADNSVDVTIVLPEGVSFKDTLPKDKFLYPLTSQENYSVTISTGIPVRIDEKTIKVSVGYDAKNTTGTKFSLIIDPIFLKDTIQSVQTNEITASLPYIKILYNNAKGEVAENIKVGDTLYAKPGVDNDKVGYSWVISEDKWIDDTNKPVETEVGKEQVYIVSPADQGKKLTVYITGDESLEPIQCKRLVSYSIAHNMGNLTATASPAAIIASESMRGIVTLTLPEGVEFKDVLPEGVCASPVGLDALPNCEISYSKPIRIDNKSISVNLGYNPEGNNTTSKFKIIIPAYLLKNNNGNEAMLSEEITLKLAPINIINDKGEVVLRNKVGDTLFVKFLTGDSTDVKYSWKSIKSVSYNGEKKVESKEVGTDSTYTIGTDDVSTNISLTVTIAGEATEVTLLSGVEHNVDIQKSATLASEIIEVDANKSAEVTITLPEGVYKLI